MTEDVNPYAAPQAEVCAAEAARPRRLVMAGRLYRLGAAILDSLFGMVAIPIALKLYPTPFEISDPVLIGSIVLTGILFVVNLTFLAQNGWTIGKRIVGIRIVRSSAAKAGVVRLIFLRGMIPSLIGMIPLVGPIFSLIDVLFIFGESRRCVHDYIADTIVVEA